VHNVREPGWSERRSKLDRGAGPGELLGRGGERAAVRWAAGCVSLGHGSILGRTREKGKGGDGPDWVVLGFPGFGFGFFLYSFSEFKPN